jgi:hypothetical protein
MTSTVNPIPGHPEPARFGDPERTGLTAQKRIDSMFDHRATGSSAGPSSR